MRRVGNLPIGISFRGFGNKLVIIERPQWYLSGLVST